MPLLLPPNSVLADAKPCAVTPPPLLAVIVQVRFAPELPGVEALACTSKRASTISVSVGVAVTFAEVSACAPVRPA